MAKIVFQHIIFKMLSFIKLHVFMKRRGRVVNLYSIPKIIASGKHINPHGSHNGLVAVAARSTSKQKRSTIPQNITNSHRTAK